MARIEIGTVSHGTLRAVDLLQVFAAELERINGTSPMIQEAYARVEALNDGADETEADSELVMEIHDALGASAPAGMYFGNTEGDGSDFGFWPSEDGRRAGAADDFARAFERRTREGGAEFLALKDGSPEWMHEAVQAAHGDFLPDDWRYRLIAAVVEDVAERLRDDPAADLDDMRHEVIDQAIPCYTAARLEWLASNLNRVDYCDDAAAEGMVSEDAGIVDRIAAGMAAELEEIFSAVIDVLNSEAE
jgi:hypothetical protein